MSETLSERITKIESSMSNIASDVEGMRSDIKGMDHAIRGNGKPGLWQRLADLKHDVDAMKSAAKGNNSRRESIISGVVTALIIMAINKIMQGY